jgi:uracil-DNA glycosylase
MNKLMIVGDFWSREDARQGGIFTGGGGQVLSHLFSSFNISPETVYLTSVLNRPSETNSGDYFLGPKSEAIPNYRAIGQGKFFRKEYAPELERLHAEIEKVNPNCILAAGNFALWALCKKTGIKKYRGTPLPSHAELTRADNTPYKVIPTYSPHTILRQWKMRPLLKFDMEKQIRENAFPEIRRPRREIWCNPSIQDIWDFYNQHIRLTKNLSCDIETKRETITEVGYAVDDKYAIVIPFYSRLKASGNYWDTLEEELEAWSLVEKINSEHGLYGQNFIYDMSYFWRYYGIACPKMVGDTMLLHHAMQPELEKGLGFLGSIYTDEPSWKFMRNDHSTLKAED